MSHPDEGLIHAWLDGELDAAEAARIEALVQSDPAWAAAAAEARGLIAATSRIVSALDDVPAHVIPAARAPEPGNQAKVIPFAAKPRGTPWWALRAAAVMVVVAGTVVVMRNGTPEVAEAVPELATAAVDLKDSAVAPLAAAPVPAARSEPTLAPTVAPSAVSSADSRVAQQATSAPTAALRKDAPARRVGAAETDAARQLATEEKAKEAVSAKLSVAAAAAPPSAPQPATAAGGGAAGAPGAVGAAGATRVAPSVTSGAAPTGERRALGFAAGAMDQAAQAEQCFREPVAPGAREPGALHRVPVGVDSVARVAEERLRARVEASADMDRRVRPSMRVRGDTLIIVGAEGTTVRALRVSCPSR